MAKMTGPYTWYWNENSFRDLCPKNWEAIASAANAAIDDYTETVEGEDSVWLFSAGLWEHFSECDEVCGVAAEW